MLLLVVLFRVEGVKADLIVLKLGHDLALDQVDVPLR